jgi:hypothetical protein
MSHYEKLKRMTGDIKNDILGLALWIFLVVHFFNSSLIIQ